MMINIYSILLVNKARFSTQNTLTGALNTDRNHNLRVMSTPTWPVPYYQRAYKHPVNLDREDGNLSYFTVPIHDYHAIMAKELLKLDGQGHVVEAIENHYDLDSYITKFGDSNAFSEAYTDDLLDCLGLAHEQNIRILSENDLSDVFNWT